jgi:hypothetical protein
MDLNKSWSSLQEMSKMFKQQQSNMYRIYVKVVIVVIV